MRAFSPEGKRIVGVLESVPTVYGIAEGSFVAAPPGGDIGWDYDGGESKSYWDSAEPVQRGGRMIFVDEDGGEWPDDKVVLRGDQDGPDESEGG